MLRQCGPAPAPDAWRITSTSSATAFNAAGQGQGVERGFPGWVDRELSACGQSEPRRSVRDDVDRASRSSGTTTAPCAVSPPSSQRASPRRACLLVGCQRSERILPLACDGAARRRLPRVGVANFHDPCSPLYPMSAAIKPPSSDPHEARASRLVDGPHDGDFARAALLHGHGDAGLRNTPRVTLWALIACSACSTSMPPAHLATKGMIIVIVGHADRRRRGGQRCSRICSPPTSPG